MNKKKMKKLQEEKEALYARRESLYKFKKETLNELGSIEEHKSIVKKNLKKVWKQINKINKRINKLNKSNGEGSCCAAPY